MSEAESSVRLDKDKKRITMCEKSKPKFKIGDRVKFLEKETNGTITGYEILDNKLEYYVEEYFDDAVFLYKDCELELVETSEQIAVKKNNEIIYQKINLFIEDFTDVDLYTAHEIQKMLDVDEADIIEFNNIAVKNFKEKIRKGIQKEMDYISKHYKEIDNHQRCTLELQYCMQLLEE